MYQGTIVFEKDTTSNMLYSKELNTKAYFPSGTQKLEYLSDGDYKATEEYKNEKNQSETNIIFHDSKKNISIGDNGFNIYEPLDIYGYDFANTSIIKAPNFRYGRGLSTLKGLSYNIEKEEISGITNNNLNVIAKIDLKHQNLATSIRVYDKKN